MRRTLALAVLGLIWLATATPAAAMSAPPAALYRAEAFARIAVARIEAGDRAGALESLALARQTVRAITAPGERAEALSHVSWAQAKLGDASGALATARDIPEPGQRLTTLTRVALALAEAGDQAAAWRAAAQAVDTLEAVQGTDKRKDEEETALVAWLQVELGDAAGALETVGRIEDQATRAGTLLAVAEAQARLGDPAGARLSAERALGIIPAITEAEVRKAFEIPGAWTLARIGDTTGALAAATSLANLERQALALSVVAAARAAAGDALGAEDTARRALDTWHSRGSLGIDFETGSQAVAQDQGLETGVGAVVTEVEPGGGAERAGVKAGDLILGFDGTHVSDAADLTRYLEATPAGATVRLESRREGESLAFDVTLDRRAESRDTFDPPQFLVKTAAAAAFAGAGDLRAGLEIFESISSLRTRVAGLGVLGVLQAAADDLAGAQLAADLALEAADGASDAGSIAGAIGMVVAVQMEMGNPADALKTVRAAGEAYDYDAMLFAVVAARVLSGDTADAVARGLDFQRVWDLFREDTLGPSVAMADLHARAGQGAAAREMTKAITDEADYYRARARIGRVKGAVMSGGLSAESTPELSLDEASSIGGPYGRALALSATAIAQAEAGEAGAARDTAERAFASAAVLEDASLRARAFRRVASALLAAGDATAARECAVRALAAARAEPTPFYRAVALAAAAEALLVAQEPDAARDAVSDAYAAVAAIEVPPESE